MIESGRERIRPEHVAHWQEHGYALIEQFLTPGELAAARAELAEYAPSWEEALADPTLIDNLGREFPYPGQTLNEIATHPDIWRFCADTLGTERIFLSASTISFKYAGVGKDHDQPLHSDYGNNTLTFPREDGLFRQILLILYYTDVTVDLSPTYALSQVHTRPHPELMIRKRLTREDDPEYYKLEVPALLPAGGALLYAMHTFHRGSAMTAKQGIRFAHHLSWRALDCTWVGHHRAWSRAADTPQMQSFLEQATLQQRGMIGFPPPDHSYWTEETVLRVGQRYPGMDMTPYREAVAAR